MSPPREMLTILLTLIQDENIIPARTSFGNNNLTFGSYNYDNDWVI